MPEPVAEQILQAVRTRLSAYTDSYRSPRVANWQPKDLVIHIYQGDIAPNDELSCPGNPPAQAYDMPVVVAGIIKKSDSETTPVDTYKNRFWAEIVKAVTNADLWYNWGGLAVNTTIGTIEDYTSEDGSAAGVKVEFLITFRVSENDPYAVRA
jgi:hypothetical protein